MTYHTKHEIEAQAGLVQNLGLVASLAQRQDLCGLVSLKRSNQKNRHPGQHDGPEKHGFVKTLQ